VLKKILAGLQEWDVSVKASIYRFHRQELLLRPAVETAAAGNDQAGTLPAEGPELAARVLRSGQAAYLPESNGQSEDSGEQPPRRAEYAVPLRARGLVLGALRLESEHPGGISADTRTLADQLAVPAALALEREALLLNLAASERTPPPDPGAPQLRDRLRQAQKMEAIGTLAGGIAHDFNNLLGVILGFASLARVRLRSADPLQEPLRMIEQAAERAAALSRQLLAFARPEKSEEMRAVPMDTVVEHVRQIITQTFDRRIQIRTQLEASLPSVLGDASMLEQVIFNLCLNARDAIAAGGTITIEGAALALAAGSKELPTSAAPGRYLRLTVMDTGAGIDPPALEHIFEPFFSTKKEGKGSGLGLAMVSEIVRRHAGFVRVESEVGRGSHFSVYLPALPYPAESPEKREPARIERGSGEVLVVDDEPMVLAFAQKALQGLGYRVLTADNGKEACKVFAPRAEEIDCVLLDLVMPEMGGLETLQRLRGINPWIKVIVSSGYDPDAETRKLIESGSVAELRKPYSLEMLARTLKANT
jgi:signal transduction histidine kinase